MSEQHSTWELWVERVEGRLGNVERQSQALMENAVHVNNRLAQIETRMGTVEQSLLSLSADVAAIKSVVVPSQEEDSEK